jgi:hypothetical protein
VGARLFLSGRKQITIKLSWIFQIGKASSCIKKTQDKRRILKFLFSIGMQSALKAYGAEHCLAYSRNGQQSILRPWGHDLAVAIQVHVADRSEETAWSPSIKYDFAHIGLKGLTGGVIYGIFDTLDSGSNYSPDRDALDFNSQYDCSSFGYRD